MSAGADRPPTSQPSGSPDRSLVFIVDDDLSLRDALSSLLRSVGHHVEVFSSASDMLKSKLPDIVSCIVLDVRMPGLSGLDLQTGLAEAGILSNLHLLQGRFVGSGIVKARHSIVSEYFRFVRRFSYILYLVVRQCRPSPRAKSSRAPPA